MGLYIADILLALLAAVGWCLWRPPAGPAQWWIPAAVAVAVFAGLCLLFFLVFGLISLTIPLHRRYDRPSRFYRAVLNVGYGYLCALAGVRVTVTGREKLPAGRFMLVSNHRSRFDNMLQSAALSREPLAYISKAGNFRIPMGRRYITRGCYLVIDRDDARQARATIDRAAELVASGAVSMGVFPEGHRGDGRQLQPLRPGCFKLAQQAGCPVVVATVSGTERIHKRFPRHTRVRFDILEVIPAGEVAALRTRELAARAEAVMTAHLNTIEKGENPS